MEKIININYQGSIIPIEETAYQHFNAYEASLRQYLSKEPDTDEIFQDLQLRMHEILTGKLSTNATFITQAHVQEVIDTIGKPSQLYAENRMDDEQPQQVPPAKIRTPLRRNANDKMISGFCSGLANYVGMDPVAVRLLMVMFTLINPVFGISLYVLALFTLKSQALPPNSERKFYRNPYNKVLGGICGGLAAFFGKEVWIFRMIFLLPLLISLFGAGTMLDDILEVGWLAGSLSGSVILLYVILWIITPVARTPQQLRLLHGQGITLNNYAEVQALNLSAQGNNRGINTFFRVVAYIIIGFALIIFIPIAFGMLVGGIMVHQLADIVLATTFMKVLFWLSLLLFFALPIIAIIIWLFRRLIGAAHNKRYVLVFGALFALGVVATIILASSLFKDMNTMNKVVYNMPLAVSGDTIFVNGMHADTGSSTVFTFNGLNNLIQDQGKSWDLRAVRFSQQRTADSLFSMQVRRYSLGGNRKEANKNAELIKYSPLFDGAQQVYIPLLMSFPKGIPYRGQNVEVVLNVPEGKTVIVDQAIIRLNHINFGSHKEYEMKMDEEFDFDWQNQHMDTLIIDDRSSNKGEQLRQAREEKRRLEKIEALEEKKSEAEARVKELEADLEQIHNQNNKP